MAGENDEMKEDHNLDVMPTETGESDEIATEDAGAEGSEGSYTYIYNTFVLAMVLMSDNLNYFTFFYIILHDR